MTSPAELRSLIEDLSRDAFALAREVADGASPSRPRKGRARRIDRQLDELVEQIQALPEDEQPSLIEAWTDARLDLAYVLAGGRGPTSLRLGAFLRDQ